MRTSEPRYGLPRRALASARGALRGRSLAARRLARAIASGVRRLRRPAPCATTWPADSDTRSVRLTPTEDGRERCVACELCALACPARCIRVEPEASPDDDRDLRPRLFEIDTLRCIACGRCEEVCPEDAIHTVAAPFPAMTSRARSVLGLSELLAPPTPDAAAREEGARP